MIEPSLALQKEVFARLRADAGVLALVNAENIGDEHGLPTVSPCIILGDDQTIRDPLTLADQSFRIAVTVHVWVKEDKVWPAKQIAGAVAAALDAEPRLDPEGHRIAWLTLSDTRYLRDPGGEWAHAVMTFEAMLEREFV